MILSCAGDTALFREQVLSLKEAAPPATRFVLVTATLPSHVAGMLSAEFPGLSLVKGPGLHRTAPGRAHHLYFSCVC